MSKPLLHLSDDELCWEAQSLHGIICQDECFGTADLIRFQVVCKELERRGYEVKEHSHLLFKKK
jgi:hypothetical protein